MFIKTSSLARKVLREGVNIRVAWGKKIMISFVNFDPHCIFPCHSHPHEQMGFVLSGKLKLTIAEESRLLQEGDAFLVPSGVEHSVQVLDGKTRVLDIFSPPREDFK